MIVQPLDALKDRLRESRVFSDAKLESVCSGPKWNAAQDIPQGLRALVAAKALTPWQAQMLYAGKTTLRFGNYVLLDRLSQDPQNRTFLAEHDSMGRRVALKQLSRQHTQNERTSQAFLAKVRAFSAVNHPRLVHLFDVSQDHDRFYVVKELVEGDNLQTSVAAGGAPSTERACRWIAEIAEGIDALHGAGIAHLDLHPGTIVARPDGSLKIFEPGVYETGQDPTHVAYLAPEVRADAGTPASDYYSLGMLAHFLLTGKHRGADGGRAPLFESEIAALTSKDPAARKPAYAGLIAAAKSKAERPAVSASTAGAYAVEEEIVEAEAVDSIIGIPQTQWDDADPLAPPPPMAGDDDFFANLDAAAAMATSAQAVLQPQPGTAAYAAAGFAPAGPAATGGFPKITLGDSGPGKATGRGSVASKPKAEAGDEEKKPPSVGMLVGLAAGGGALAVLALVGVAAVVYMLAFGEKPVEVAQRSNATKGPITAKVTPTKGAVTPKASVEAAGDTTDKPASTTDAPAPASGGFGAPQAEEEEEAEPSDLGFTFAAEGETPTTPAPATDPPAPAAPEVAPPPTATDPAPAATPDPAPTTPPAEAAPAPPATTPPADMPAPATPAPTSPAPTSALPDPFGGKRQDAVDLPVGIGENAVTTPVPIYQVRLNPGDLFLVNLAGGEVAMKGNKKFALTPARGGLAPNEFEISLDGSAALRNDNLIAHLKLVENDLTFQWTPAAAKDPESAYLKNCTLELSTGTHAMVMDLRKPVPMEPILLVDLAGWKESVPIAEVPDPETLVVKIQGLSADFPYGIIGGSMEQKVGDPPMNIILGGNDGAQPVKLGVQTSYRKGAVQIALQPTMTLTLADQQMTRDLKPDTMVALDRSFAASRSKLEQEISLIKNNVAAYDANPNQQQKTAMKPAYDAAKGRLPMAEAELKALGEAATKMAAVSELVEKLRKGVTVHYRVTIGPGDSAKVLAATPDATNGQVDGAAIKKARQDAQKAAQATAAAG